MDGVFGRASGAGIVSRCARELKDLVFVDDDVGGRGGDGDGGGGVVVGIRALSFFHSILLSFAFSF